MSDIVNTAPETKKPGRSGQIVLSLLIFAGFVVLMFVPAYYGFNDKSLWTVFLNLFKGEFKPEGFAALALYGTVAAYVVLLLCTVASMLTRRTAAVVLNYLKTVVMLAATVLMIFSFIKQGSVFADIFYAEKTFVQINATVLSVFFGVLALILLNFSVYKGIGAVKLVYTILAAAFFASRGSPSEIRRYRCSPPTSSSSSDGRRCATWGLPCSRSSSPRRASSTSSAV